MSTTNYTYASLLSGSEPHWNPRVSVSLGGGYHVRGRDPPRTSVSSIGGPHVRGQDKRMEEIDLTNSDDDSSVDTDVVGDVGSADVVGGDPIVTNTTSRSRRVNSIISCVSSVHIIMIYLLIILHKIKNRYY